MIELAPDVLRGSYPPLVTPLREGEVDYDTYARLVESQIRGGSHGVVVNGTTGEPTTLTLLERTRLVATAVKAAGGRIPVVAATGSQSLAESVELTQAAEEAGAHAGARRVLRGGRPPDAASGAHLSHSRPRLGRDEAGHDRADRGPAAKPGGAQARRERSRLRHGGAAPARPRIPHLRRARGSELPHARHRRQRPDERSRQHRSPPGGGPLPRCRPRRCGCGAAAAR